MHMLIARLQVHLYNTLAYPIPQVLMKTIYWHLYLSDQTSLCFSILAVYSSETAAVSFVDRVCG